MNNGEEMQIAMGIVMRSYIPNLTTQDASML